MGGYGRNFLISSRGVSRNAVRMERKGSDRSYKRSPERAICWPPVASTRVLGVTDAPPRSRLEMRFSEFADVGIAS